MSYPTSPTFNGLSFRGQFYNVRNESISGRTQVRHLGGHRWSWTASYPSMRLDQFQPIYAYLQSLNALPFEIVLPGISTKSGDAYGNVVTNASSDIGDTTIAVTGLSGTLKAGDLIRFSNHTKVYMIVDDLAENGGLVITPGLRAEVPNNDVITYDSVPFTARLDNDIQEYRLGAGDIVRFELNMVEAV